MTNLEKLEYIHFAIQEAMNNLRQFTSMIDSELSDDPELTQALEYVEDLREPYLNHGNGE